jgi:multiple sugar transport system permease protein
MIHSSSTPAAGDQPEPAAAPAAAPTAGATRRWRMSAPRRRETLVAYLFVLPTLAGFLIFVLGPILGGLGLSFYQFDFFSTPRFVGLDNFRQMLSDQRVARIFTNTIIYVAGTVLLDLAWALALALAIHSAIPHLFKLTFRAVFFFPILTAGAVVAIVWQYLFNMDLGVINYYLGQIGIPKIPWLVSSQWAIPAVILMIVWNGVGFNMILLLAGLQSIPQELYEAASIDGAGRTAGFRFITLPLLSPIIFFILVKGVIGVLQLFDGPYVLTGGGPGDASRSVLMYIYEIGFKTLRLGYASAVGLILFILILIVTVVQFVGGRRWVFYN